MQSTIRKGKNAIDINAIQGELSLITIFTWEGVREAMTILP
jgi:hypothetical protein